MTKQERDKMRELALAATPGEWGLVKGSFLYQTDIKAGADTLLTVYGENGENAANAAYIAAANPATILALLDRVDELEGALAEAKANIQFVPTAETVRDAERYRWWVQHGWFYRGRHCLQDTRPLRGEIGVKEGQTKKQAIDAAVDAAILAAAPGAGGES